MQANDTPATPFRVGQPVIDRDQRAEVTTGDRDQTDLGVGYVTAVTDDTASERFINGIDTVADKNPRYPTDDPVVELVFADTLHSTVPARERENWDRSNLGDHLADYSNAWGIPVPTYSYPASRLADARDAKRDGAPVTIPAWVDTEERDDD